ncbi:MAG TPA: sugar ABC transporter ATP-binding protein [Candidatus Dormibacteraeota bacterium]
MQVLKRVSFELRAGEIHALLGGNGAGKSTLMKVLTGIYPPDGGQIEIYGVPVQFRSARDAKAAGIAMIFQELSLVPALSVAQNICLNREVHTKLGLIDDAACNRIASNTLRQMEVDIDPRQAVASLSTSQRQLVEIAKALSQGARIVIMDEPTASLATHEVEVLFDLCRRLRDRGIAIVFVSHRMEEVFQVSDRLTVLRDGVNVLTTETAKATLDEVVAHIVGQRAKNEFVWRLRAIDRTVEPMVAVRHLSTDRLRDISFDVFPGEVLGVAGLMGSGRTRLMRTLFGMEKVRSGSIQIAGRPAIFDTPGQAVDRRVALVPEDRRSQGLILQHSIRDNIMLPLLRKLSRWTFVDDSEGSNLVRRLSQELRIVSDSIDKPVGLLSGGNQQKVVIAKWLGAEATVLLLDEPTAGVDVSVKTQILGMIRDLADQGKAVIVVSSELPELIAVSDRILVMRDGRVHRMLERPEIGRATQPAGDSAFMGDEESLHRALQAV